MKTNIRHQISRCRPIKVEFHNPLRPNRICPNSITIFHPLFARSSPFRRFHSPIAIVNRLSKVARWLLLKEAFFKKQKCHFLRYPSLAATHHGGTLRGSSPDLPPRLVPLPVSHWAPMSSRGGMCWTPLKHGLRVFSVSTFSRAEGVCTRSPPTVDLMVDCSAINRHNLGSWGSRGGTALLILLVLCAFLRLGDEWLLSSLISKGGCKGAWNRWIEQINFKL